MIEELEVLEPETDVSIDAAIKELVTPNKVLIVYNDDVNTFQHVVECFMKYCGHSEEQALQCAYIIHYKGRCDVKRGTHEKLKPVCEALLENGIRAKIEE
jgi:ATP-dependent Clp protease adaptor protein ClpS